MIAAERRRQIEVEGYDTKHDLTHKPGDIALAGACYACNASAWLGTNSFGELGKKYAELSQHGFRWPFEDKYWKPKNPLSDLVRAGALIAAEIDRMLAESKKG